MHIVATTRQSARIGGAEAYVERLLGLLVSLGHDVTVVFDLMDGDGSATITVPNGVAVHCLQTDGLEAVVRAVNAMDDAVVLANSLDSELYASGRRLRHPLVLYAHTYISSCINGMRLNRKPVPAPCRNVFGPACLLHYYPLRCGGLSPLTMITSFRRQNKYRSQLSQFDLVIANSEALASQFEHVGIVAEVLHYPEPFERPGTVRTAFLDETRRSLAFVGRFEISKGGSQLLAALPHVANALGRPVILTMVGDGRVREEWEREAADVSRRNPAVTVRFTGWLPPNGVAGALEQSDLLVVPSVWPEPFGLVGLEGACFGLPSAAFAVGGIPEWLTDGVNGYLADGRSCDPRDLAAAIVLCLSDVDTYRRLSIGAVERRATFTANAHLRRLQELFQMAIESRTTRTD